MRVSGRFHRKYIFFIWVMVFFVSAAFAGAKEKAEEEKATVGLVDVKACEGVEITQCELAKNLINTLKMGEDLTCEACFIHLQALGIAPGEDWNYEDPHKVVSVEEIREVALEVHGAYNDGSVRLDGFEAAAGVNRFCRAMKGPSATPAPIEKEEEKAEPATEAEPQTEAEAETETAAEAVTETEIEPGTEAATATEVETKTEAETATEAEPKAETSVTPPSQDAPDQGPAPSEEAEQEETPPAGAQESDNQKETSE